MHSGASCTRVELWLLSQNRLSLLLQGGSMVNRLIGYLGMTSSLSIVAHYTVTGESYASHKLAPFV